MYEPTPKTAGEVARTPALTLRVYRISQDGRITSDSGTREYYDGYEPGTATNRQMSNPVGLPPCSCPHCRRGRS